MIEWTLSCGRCPNRIIAHGETAEAVMRDILHRTVALDWMPVIGGHVCPECTTDRDRKLDALHRLAERCNDDELDVHLDIAQRVDRGRPEHGSLVISLDLRDFEREEECEYLDAIVYRAIQRIRRRRALQKGSNA